MIIKVYILFCYNFPDKNTMISKIVTPAVQAEIEPMQHVVPQNEPHDEPTEPQFSQVS